MFISLSRMKLHYLVSPTTDPIMFHVLFLGLFRIDGVPLYLTIHMPCAEER